MTTIAKVTRVPRVLSPDTYDALELAALRFGGIGAGAWAMYPGGDVAGLLAVQQGTAVPVCAVGFAHYLDYTVAEELDFTGVGVSQNDWAVAQINRRKGVTRDYARVSFADWCAELGVVREES